MEREKKGPKDVCHIRGSRWLLPPSPPLYVEGGGEGGGERIAPAALAACFAARCKASPWPAAALRGGETETEITRDHIADSRTADARACRMQQQPRAATMSYSPTTTCGST